MTQELERTTERRLACLEVEVQHLRAAVEGLAGAVAGFVPGALLEQADPEGEVIEASLSLAEQLDARRAERERRRRG